MLAFRQRKKKNHYLHFPKMKDQKYIQSAYFYLFNPFFFFSTLDSCPRANCFAEIKLSGLSLPRLHFLFLKYRYYICYFLIRWHHPQHWRCIKILSLTPPSSCGRISRALGCKLSSPNFSLSNSVEICCYVSCVYFNVHYILLFENS